MDVTLLFMGIAVLLVIYLIFKFIKKLVFAVFTLILFVVLVIGGIAGLVYMDYNYLTSQNDFDLKIIYQKDDILVFGSNVKIINKSIDIESLSGISSSELAALKLDDIKSDDKMFVVVFDDVLLKSILSKDNYEFEQFKSEDFSGYDLSLTRFDVIEILNSVDDTQTFLNIIEKSNKITGPEKIYFESEAKKMIESELGKNSVSIREVVFLGVVSEEISNEKNAVNLVEGFKNDELKIYPERFVFKIVRLLPVEMVKSYLPDFATN